MLNLGILLVIINKIIIIVVYLHGIGQIRLVQLVLLVEHAKVVHLDLITNLEYIFGRFAFFAHLDKQIKSSTLFEEILLQTMPKTRLECGLDFGKEKIKQCKETKCRNSNISGVLITTKAVKATVILVNELACHGELNEEFDFFFKIGKQMLSNFCSIFFLNV